MPRCRQLTSWKASWLDDDPADKRFDELSYALAMYSRSEGRPYFEADEVRKGIRQAMALIL